MARIPTEAEAFLADQLGGGERPAVELERLALTQGLAWRTVRRAAVTLGVRKQRRGFGKGSASFWYFPRRMAETT